VTAPRVVLFDIGSTLWSSPPEDPGALESCYDRGRKVLLSAIPEVPDVRTLIDAVEGYFAEWEDIWRADPGRVQQGPTTEFVATALSRIGILAPPDALKEFTDAILETSVGTAKVEPPEPGMKEALTALRVRGLRLGCVSNAFMGAATLHRIMEARGFGDLLDGTVSSCEMGIRKPHPAIYEAGLKIMNASASETIFVGDRLDADVEGPAALGMRTVLTHQYRQEDPSSAKVRPDHVMNHLSELAPWLDTLSD
jgi:HAD superfamily hydrolase (TIGR01509 family)